MKIASFVELTCVEVTELMTDYMHARLEPADRVHFEQHLYACTWCMTYLTQLRRSVEWTGQLGAAASPVSPRTREALGQMFRRLKDRGTP